jgi:hypothetical protein
MSDQECFICLGSVPSVFGECRAGPSLHAGTRRDASGERVVCYGHVEHVRPV